MEWHDVLKITYFTSRLTENLVRIHYYIFLRFLQDGVGLFHFQIGKHFWICPTTFWFYSFSFWKISDNSKFRIVISKILWKYMGIFFLIAQSGPIIFSQKSIFASWIFFVKLKLETRTNKFVVVKNWWDRIFYSIIIFFKIKSYLFEPLRE